MKKIFETEWGDYNPNLTLKDKIGDWLKEKELDAVNKKYIVIVEIIEAE